ncbi:MAG: four helix bundle protein [Nitrospira sp.]|nr:four helix bundle protein [Nitrospira sp.]
MKVEDLDVFKLAHNLTLKVYEITASYPESERFGLTSQMRRASTSVCMNLMEGAYRISKNEYKHFVSISRGSCGEVKYQLMLSKDLGYLDEGTFKEMTEAYERVSMMLTKLHSSLK